MHMCVGLCVVDGLDELTTYFFFVFARPSPMYPYHAYVRWLPLSWLLFLCKPMGVADIEVE